MQGDYPLGRFPPTLLTDPKLFLPRRCPIATEISPAAEPQVDTKSIDEKERKRLEAARHFAIDAARLAAQTHCNNIVVLDVSAISPITDFLIIATGTSSRQMRTVCEEIEEMGAPQNFNALSKPAYESDHWVLVDFVDAIVHVFNTEARLFYDLENLWGDGKKVEWREV